ncbi:hypothetical protein SAMN04487886_104326 [Clostridium sp. DSM 8431]|uniref:hypothetical protein n=1 Tax=Clostridium sp. DSM 8431 TaxID=1761781 RepID=UPI0008F1BEB6|nr:hypothetical protein [Clostridium sp. DSM 8431]SFU50831.1 hypothetical protein SAMN04487886_104326 [Clostridium sp. DSM 8431]
MKKWVISCNLKGNDVLQNILETGSTFYETAEDINVNDEVFVYAREPLNALFLKCSVKKTLEENIDKDYIKGYNKKRIELIPIENYLSDIDKLSYNNLLSYGLKDISFDCEVNKDLLEYLDSIRNENNFIY